MGDIKKSIRDAFSKKTESSDMKSKIRTRLKEAEASKYDPDTQPNLYELSNFLRKSGYRLVDVVGHEQGLELVIEAIKEGYLYPEIFHDVEEGLFYAKVTEHGLLVASDLEEIMKGYTTALGVLRHLESIKLESLEIGDKDEE